MRASSDGFSSWLRPLPFALLARRVSTRTPTPPSGVCQVFAAVEVSCAEIIGLRMCASFVVLATTSGQGRATDEFTSRRIRDAMDLEDARWRGMLMLSLVVAECTSNLPSVDKLPWRCSQTGWLRVARDTVWASLMCAVGCDVRSVVFAYCRAC